MAVSLKQKAATGAIWFSLGTFCNKAVSLLVSIILARLILPEDFGIVAIINTFVLLFIFFGKYLPE